MSSGKSGDPSLGHLGRRVVGGHVNPSSERSDKALRRSGMRCFVMALEALPRGLALCVD